MHLILATLCLTAALSPSAVQDPGSRVPASGADPLSPSPRETSPERLAAVIDAVVAEEMKATHLPGAAVVIVQRGKVLLQRGYGLADVDTGRAVDPEKTLMRIGSVSKAMTALAVRRLIDAGKLRWDQDVTRAVPGVLNPGNVEGPVTLWNLLTHTGGFDQIGGPDRHVYRFELPLEERKALRPSLGEYLSGGRLRRVTPAGQVFRYDTYGITLAGHLVEQATELPFPQAMRKTLFEPAGMDSTFIEAEGESLEKLALGYGWVDGEYVAQPYEVYVTTPASSVDATPADMGRLLIALTGGGTGPRGRLFSEEALAEILGPQYRAHPRYAGITHGLWESPSVSPPDGPGIWSVGHGGSMRGYFTQFEIFPGPGLGFFVITNRAPEAGGGDIGLGSAVMRAALAELVGEIPPAPILAADPDRQVDLEAYSGSYFNGVHCRTCTPEELALGGWARGQSIVVEPTEGGLRLGNYVYLPTAEDDVFVRNDGQSEVLFGRDAAGRVAFYVDSRGPYAMERMED